MEYDAYLGKTFGHYLIQEPIKNGRLGPIFRAEHTGLHRQVALRLLAPQFPEDLQQKSLLYRGGILQKLSHPNIPALLDFGALRMGQYGTYLYSAFAWSPGHDLEAELELRGPLAERIGFHRQGNSRVALPKR